MTVLLLVLNTFTLLAFGSVPEPKKVPTVMVSPAKRIDLFEVLTYPARIVPRINANVLAESDGVVTKILAPLGQKVGKRQRLMVITHTDPIYQYAPVILTAPVGGIVSQVDVTEGSLVSKGQRLATVTDPTQVRIMVEIAAVDLPLVKTGLAGELKMPGIEESVKVKVRGVSPFVDSATGTASCEIEALGPVAPGAMGQIRFSVNQHQGFSLPDHAVVYKGGQTFLRTVVEGKAKYNLVTLGRKQRGAVEILKGLEDGAKVIERASGFITEGEVVTAQETKL